MQLELSEQTVLELCSMAYRVWSYAYDELKEVKKETNDGSKDWDLFHAERLKKAIKTEQARKQVLDEIRKYFPQPIN